jgi:hypothetical protein
MSSEIELKSKRFRYTELAYWLLGFIIMTLIIPLILIMLLPANLRFAGFATFAAAPVLQTLAISVGIGYGVHPIISFLITVLPCIGIFMLIIGILGFVGDSSARAMKFLNKIRNYIDKYPKLKKYGVASSFLFVMFLGIYICSGIVILLGWTRWKSIAFMAGGVSFMTFLIGLGTIGIIDLLFV